MIPLMKDPNNGEKQYDPRLINKNFASSEDIATVMKILKEMPTACQNSCALASKDGSITVFIDCAGN
jgi:hypothetical protein